MDRDGHARGDARTRLLRPAERGFAAAPVRRTGRASVPSALPGATWAAEHAAGRVFPDALGGVLRGVGLGARDRMAGGRLSVVEEVPGVRSGREDTGSFHDLADATSVLVVDTTGCVQVGAEASGVRAGVGGGG